MRILLTLALAIFLVPASAIGLNIAPAELAFVAADRGVPQIFVIGADGTGRRQLTSAAEPSTTPVWSPDGQKIAFVRHTGDNSQIYIMNADGGSQRALPRARAVPLHQHGLRTAGRLSSPQPEMEYRRLRRCGVTGASDAGDLRAQRGREGGAARRPESYPVRPAWSPDGRQIAFLLLGSGTVVLAVTDASGGRLRRLADDVYGDLSARPVFSWRPR